MTKPKIIILTDKNGFFGQTRKPWVSIDTLAFIQEFKEAGFETRTFTFDEIANSDKMFEGCIIIYTFSQKFHIRQYINDIILHLSKNNTVIPRFDFLKCHEDKGYQELLKKELGIRSLKAYYFSDPSMLNKADINYPAVLKATDGSNGKQVWLAKDKEELADLLKKHFVSITVKDKVDLTRRKYFRKQKSYKEYPDYTNQKDLEQYTEYVTEYKPFIIQEFIPDLEFDYRVLFLYDRIHIEKRLVRKDDFRASGAKKFDFDFKPSQKLLDFAGEIHKKLKNPVLSLDICEKDGKFYLIEYQALHFGINVFLNSRGYYYGSENGWIFKDKTDTSFESELARAYIKHIRNIYL